MMLMFSLSTHLKQKHVSFSARYNYYPIIPTLSAAKKYFKLYAHYFHPLLQFYHLGITHPNYVFITHGWYQTRWWSQEVASSNITCSDDEMMDMLQGVIAVQQFPVAKNSSFPTASGLVWHFCRNTHTHTQSSHTHT